MVAAVLVHPQSKVVIPIAVEPIIQQDGNNKNDCERNAVRRLLKLVRKLHPKLKCIAFGIGGGFNRVQRIKCGRCDREAVQLGDSIRTRTVDHGEVGRGWPLPLEDRERDVQYVEEPRLPPGPQLWSRREVSFDGLRDANVFGVPGGPSATIKLPVACQGNG